MSEPETFLDGRVTLHCGDSREVLRAIPDASIHAVVTDPPYALVSIGKRFGKEGAAPAQHGRDGAYARASAGFMGKQWDTGETAFAVEFWREVLRVLKPGGHLVAFSGTRTYHRMACAIEDAGFEIRDSIYWHYGSGFPKSHSVNKALEAKGLACNCHTATPYNHNEDATQNLHSVRCRMDAEGQVSSGAQPDVQPAMQGDADKQDSGSRESGADDSVCDVRGVGPQTGVAVEAKRKGVLQRIVPEQVVCGSAEALRCERQGEEESRQGDGAREEPCLEGRCNAEASARELQGSSVYTGAGVGEADGSQGRLHNGASSSDGQDVRISTDPHGSGEPHRQDASEQRSDKSGTVADKRGPQTWGGWPLCGGCGKPIIAEGLGTALKPATEPICLARKPLEGTVAANVLSHGTGALNIDGCRIEWPSGHAPEIGTPGWGGPGKKLTAVPGQSGETVERAPPNGAGRWPANIVHDGSPEVVAAFPETSSGTGDIKRASAAGYQGNALGRESRAAGTPMIAHGDSGSAARFFYQVEKDDRCDLCRVLLSGKNVKHLSCDAITAKQNSQIPNTHVEGTAHFDAAASQQLERGGRKLPPSSHVHVAGNRSEQCHQRGDNTVLSDALTLETSRIALSVRSAANLCGSCETDIARSLAATRLGLDPASLRCLEFMPEHEGKILSQHLALYVAGRESIDTITTTASLKTLFGSVFHAIADTTNSEKAEGEENTGRGRRLFYSSKADADDRLGSKHPTVKPVDLMQWLCRLVTPPGGTVLDPFAGTGTTGEAAWREGFSAVLVEREAEYQADIRRRMKLALGGPDERKHESIKARHGHVEAGPLFSNLGAAE